MKDLLKIVISALSATLLTGAAAWITLGRDVVSRQEMALHVAQNGPWVTERGEVVAGIRENTRNIAKLEEFYRKLIDAQQQLIVKQQVLVTKVEALLDQNR